MKRKLSTIFILLVIMFQPNGYGQTSISQELEKLNGLLAEVVTKKYTYSQELSWSESNPFVLTIAQERIDKKNKVETIIYSFNLMDIDQNTVRTKTEKDIIIVPLFVEKKKRYIKVYKGSVQEPYVDRVNIMAVDIQNAREIEDIVDSIVEKSKNEQSFIVPESLDACMDWLADNIKEVVVDDDSYLQTFSEGTMTSHIVTLETTSKNETNSQTYNLADVEQKSIELTTKGIEVFVPIVIDNKQKYIDQFQDGEHNYINKSRVMADAIDEGRHLSAVLSAAVGFAIEIEKNRMDLTTIESDIQVALSEKINDLELDGKDYEQSLSSTCVSSYELNIADSKGVNSMLYNFDFGDLDKESVDLKIKSGKLSLSISTNNERLVKVTKNGEQQSYSGQIEFTASDIENAKWLDVMLKEAINKCAIESDEKFDNYSDEDIDKAISNLAQNDNLSQELKIDREKGVWQFTQVTITKKETLEELFEVGLTDINKEAIEFKISGKSLAVEIETKGKEKIIKYYENGEPSDYKNSFVIQMDDIEAGKALIESLKLLVEKSKSK